MRSRIAGIVAAAACLAVALAVAGRAAGANEAPPSYRVVVPLLSRGAMPTPTPVPVYTGPVVSLAIPAAGVSASSPIEQRDTHEANGREVLDDPSGPAYIAWYSRFGHPGFGGGNILFAAHINYMGYGNGPFAYLTSLNPGDALYVTMGDETVYTYAVQSVRIIPLNEIDMDDVVYPDLPANVERVTLISCGGTFVPRPGGGGEYDSRVVVVAERTVN